MTLYLKRCYINSNIYFHKIEKKIVVSCHFLRNVNTGNSITLIALLNLDTDKSIDFCDLRWFWFYM